MRARRWQRAGELLRGGRGAGLLRALGLAALVLALGCGTGRPDSDLDVRTFELEHIEPSTAQRIIDPYVFADRGGMISIDEGAAAITVRESPEMLSRIADVLGRFDKPAPVARLHFRIIEADGGPESDPALADIEAALPKEVFRFKNYRLAGEAVMTGREGSRILQHVAGPRGRYVIEGRIGDIRAVDDSGRVQLEVQLWTRDGVEVFGTAVNARVGQTLVLGSAQPAPDRGALILAVDVALEKP